MLFVILYSGRKIKRLYHYTQRNIRVALGRLPLLRRPFKVVSGLVVGTSVQI